MLIFATVRCRFRADDLVDQLLLQHLVFKDGFGDSRCVVSRLQSGIIAKQVGTCQVRVVVGGFYQFRLPFIEPIHVVGGGVVLCDEQQIGGVLVRKFPTVMPCDEFEHSQGWKGA
ncbi:MAG: hypothetical protein I8H67_02375 [Comamonadaceae bacterium]|nr:hypothetical protein [Comamonadaceae bacterium]